MSELEHAERVHAAIGEIRDITDVGDVIAVRWPFAAWQTSDGHVTIHSLLGPDYCGLRRLLDLAGYGTTQANGRVELSLNAFHCLDRPPAAGTNTLGYDHPVHVVATPRGDNPAILTVAARIDATTAPQDVKITVASWDTNGAAAGGIPFNWRCLVPITEIVG